MLGDDAGRNDFGPTTAPAVVPDKIAQGVIWEPPATPQEAAKRIEAELGRLRDRRDAARWYVVAGFGMLFAGGFSIYFAMGGVVMATYGAVAYMYWSRRMGLVEDPWDDEEIDRWEQEELQRQRGGNEPEMETDAGGLPWERRG